MGIFKPVCFDDIDMLQWWLHPKGPTSIGRVTGEIPFRLFTAILRLAAKATIGQGFVNVDGPDYHRPHPIFPVMS